MDRRMLALALLIPACAGNKPPPVAAPAPSEEAVLTFEATLRVDPEPGARHFGVWLEQAGQDPLLADLGTPSCFRPFDGRRVAVTGERLPQTEQALAPQFRIATLTLVDPASQPEVALHSVGPEVKLMGLAETLAGEPGSKMEGSTWAAFTADGVGTYQIWDSPADLPQDTRMTVTARPVEVSPYMGHMPGPTLWIGAFVVDSSGD